MQKSCPMYTPWGRADSIKEVAVGAIWSVGTPSHGGYYLTDEQVAQMPEALREARTFTGEPNWFEEDCDWALVACAFPSYFETIARQPLYLGS